MARRQRCSRRRTTELKSPTPPADRRSVDVLATQGQAGLPHAAVPAQQGAATSHSQSRQPSPLGPESAPTFGLDRVSSLTQGFSELTGLASALLDGQGATLAQARWQPICTEFHLQLPELAEHCLVRNPAAVARAVEPGSEGIYTCPCGLHHAATPVIVDGRQAATVLVGQFLLAEPDIARFRAQAASWGFAEETYLEALSEVPVLSPERLEAAIGFLRDTADLVGELAFEAGRAEAQAAERLKVQERLRRTLGRLNRSVDAAVGALARTVEMRDPYTAGHQERVSQLAVAIGRCLELPPKSITSLRISGLVHDLGKMAVPAEILTKPSTLSEAEMMLLRGHAQTAYEVLHQMRFPGPVARIVRDHHERLDGSGYPRGLRQDRIRLESKILAVADVVEAMSAHRPYRPALGIEAALEEIDDQRGRLYDAAAVEACLWLFREEEFKLTEQG